MCGNISDTSVWCYIWFIAQLCATTLLWPWDVVGQLLQKAFYQLAENLKIALKALHDVLSSAILPSHGAQSDQTSPYLN